MPRPLTVIAAGLTAATAAVLVLDLARPALAEPVREVLPEQAPLPTDDYLDQIAREAGDTLAGVWETDPEATVRWIRQALSSELEHA